jgi:hypothetical protein
VIVMILIGVLGSILVGGFGQLIPVGRQEAALGKARLLDAARCSYALTMPAATETWAGTAGDEARFSLLSGLGILNGAASDYLSSQGGYTLSLAGSLRSSTQVLKDGILLAGTP